MKMDIIRSWSSGLAHITANTNERGVTLCGRKIKLVDNLNLLSIEDDMIGGEHGYRQCCRCGSEDEYRVIHQWHLQAEKEREAQRKIERERAVDATRIRIERQRQAMQDVANILSQRFEVRFEKNRIYIRPDDDLGWLLLKGTSYGPDD